MIRRVPRIVYSAQVTAIVNHVTSAVDLILWILAPVGILALLYDNIAAVHLLLLMLTRRHANMQLLSSNRVS